MNSVGANSGNTVSFHSRSALGAMMIMAEVHEIVAIGAAACHRYIR